MRLLPLLAVALLAGCATPAPSPGTHGSSAPAPPSPPAGFTLEGCRLFQAPIDMATNPFNLPGGYNATRLRVLGQVPFAYAYLEDLLECDKVQVGNRTLPDVGLALGGVAIQRPAFAPDANFAQYLLELFTSNATFAQALRDAGYPAVQADLHVGSQGNLGQATLTAPGVAYRLSTPDTRLNGSFHDRAQWHVLAGGRHLWLDFAESPSLGNAAPFAGTAQGGNLQDALGAPAATGVTSFGTTSAEVSLAAAP